MSPEARTRVERDKLITALITDLTHQECCGHVQGYDTPECCGIPDNVWDSTNAEPVFTAVAKFFDEAIASALAQARAEAFEEAARAAKVPVLDPRKSEDWHAGYIDGQTTSIAAIREKAKP